MRISIEMKNFLTSNVLKTMNYEGHYDGVGSSLVCPKSLCKQIAFYDLLIDPCSYIEIYQKAYKKSYRRNN